MLAFMTLKIQGGETMIFKIKNFFVTLQAN